MGEPALPDQRGDTMNYMHRPPTAQVKPPYAVLCLLLVGQLFVSSAEATLVSAVLPTSRSAQVESPITVFATVLNAGTTTANSCLPALGLSLIHI